MMRVDRLALTVHATALALIAVLSGLLLFKVMSVPETPKPAERDSRLAQALNELRKRLEPAKAVPPPAVPRPAPKAAVPVQKAPPMSSLQLVDLRPMKEKRDYDAMGEEGFQVLGDSRLVPDQLSVLRERLATRLGQRVAGKPVQLSKLMTLHVRTPSRDAERMWGIPGMRSAPYWIICDVAFAVDGRGGRGRAARGFSGDAAQVDGEHRRALLDAIDQAIAQLQ